MGAAYDRLPLIATLSSLQLDVRHDDECPVLGEAHRNGLGRKHTLDALLAATYAASGVRRILSTNARDYRIFDELQVVNPTDPQIA